jgi:hypothetical protein
VDALYHRVARGAEKEGAMEEHISWDDVYRFMEELKALARRLLMMERNASLQTTGLVNTALRRLHRKDQDWDTMTWANRHELCQLAKFTMRQALIDHMRMRQRRERREVLQAPEVLEAVVTFRTLVEKAPPLVVALGTALERLAQEKPDWEALVTYRSHSIELRGGVVSTHRKPLEVRICRLRNQSIVGTRPPSTSTPHWPAC